MTSCVTPPLPGDVLQQPEFVVAVHHDPAGAVLQRHLQLPAQLVVAVEVDEVGRELHGLGDRELSSGHDVQSEALLHYQARHGRVHERLCGVKDAGIRVPRPELADELAAHTPEGCLVEHVEGRSELAGQLHGVAAAQRQVIAVVYRRRHREQAHVIERHRSFFR